MPRTQIFIAAVVLLAANIACKRAATPAPLVIHVLRDPTAIFAAGLRQADREFALSNPHLRNGKWFMVASNEGGSFLPMLRRFIESTPDLLILDSSEDIPSVDAVHNQLTKPILVCGQHPAYIPTSVSGDSREAAQMYLQFLVSRCGVTTVTDTTAEVQGVYKDPNRPPCTSARCEKIKAFLKSHYCGESPAGNGPDDGCDTRGFKKPVPGNMITAEYFCDWNDASGTSKCQQRSLPSSSVRAILIREMRKVGLPPRASNEVHFTVLESPSSGWSLMAANYDHVSGTDLTLCQVVVAADRSGQVHALRKVLLQKTGADTSDVTTWSPVDIQTWMVTESWKSY
jgi:hypothetical protein